VAPKVITIVDKDYTSVINAVQIWDLQSSYHLICAIDRFANRMLSLVGRRVGMLSVHLGGSVPLHTIPFFFLHYYWPSDRRKPLPRANSAATVAKKANAVDAAKASLMPS
jgi:hypothetical protein